MPMKVRHDGFLFLTALIITISMAGKGQNENKGKDIAYFVAYFLTWLTGIIFYFVAGDNKRMKFHALQALFIGIAQIVIGLAFSFIRLGTLGGAINILITLYAWYVGFKASQGTDVMVPYISKYAKDYSGY